MVVAMKKEKPIPTSVKMEVRFLASYIVILLVKYREWYLRNC
jgi:hypothetical protein